MKTIETDQRITLKGRLTLRDWFAALSMQAHRQAMSNKNSKDIAAWAYEDADAMLAERIK